MLDKIDEKDKRTLILLGAMKVFARKGFHDAKVDEIAQEAGVGKGTVYEYFSSKEDLFKEMVMAGLNKLCRSIVEEVKQSKSIREKLFKVFITNYDFANKHKDNMALFMEVHRGIKEDLHKWMIQVRNDQINLVEGIIREGVDSGEFRQVNANLAARIFFGATKAITTCCVFGEELEDPEQNFEEVMDILLKGLQS